MPLDCKHGPDSEQENTAHRRPKKTARGSYHARALLTWDHDTWKTKSCKRGPHDNPQTTNKGYSANCYTIRAVVEDRGMAITHTNKK